MPGWSRSRPREPAGSITSRSGGCMPSRPIWRASGAMLPRGSGCWPRTPKGRPGSECPAADLFRRRMLRRARVHRVDLEDRHVVAARPYRYRAGRPRRPAERRRRADIRTDIRWHRARLGRGDCLETSRATGLPLASTAGPRRRHRGGDQLPCPGRRNYPDRDRAPRLGAGRERWRTVARSESHRLADAAAALSGRDRERRRLMTAGTKEDPWVLKTPPGTSQYTIYKDEQSDPPALVCPVGSTTLKYHLQAIGDLHAWLAGQRDWVLLGAADEKKPAVPGTVEAWGRSPDNPVGGWYGLRNGYRGRFGMYLPPLLEVLGLAEVTHDARNNRMRAASVA